MKLYIKEFEEAIQAGAATGAEFNFKAFRAYLDSKESGFDRVNFQEIIWDQDIPGIVKTLRGYGISEFTFSNSASGILETLSCFEANGAIVLGLTKITGSKGTSPAFLLKVI